MFRSTPLACSFSNIPHVVACHGTLAVGGWNGEMRVVRMAEAGNGNWGGGWEGSVGWNEMG